jgi:hypothetical protein
MIVPAVLVSGVIIFMVGYALTSSILEKVPRIPKKLRKKKGNPTYYRDTGLEVGERLPMEKDTIDYLSKLGGGAAVGLTIVLYVILPPPWRTVFWIILTALGVLGGLLTFLLRE